MFTSLRSRLWLSYALVITVALTIVSIVLVVVGTRLLRQMGKQDEGRNDASLYAFEKTSKLVTVGLYRYIRHPLYSSLFFLGWGSLRVFCGGQG